MVIMFRIAILIIKRRPGGVRAWNLKKKKKGREIKLASKNFIETRKKNEDKSNGLCMTFLGGQWKETEVTY
jgi:hypothetical protein